MGVFATLMTRVRAMELRQDKGVFGGGNNFSSFDVHILWVVIALVAPSR
jgi:hypothetical protein